MYYILYRLDTLKVVHIYTTPNKPYDKDIYGIAEYHGINGLPKGDWLSVANIHEEVETWKEKQTQYKTITELEAQEQWNIVYEEITVEDENGNPIQATMPKRVKQIVNVEVEKEVEEEVEVEKSKTHIICDLVAHFYPKIELTEEQKAKQQQLKYERLCQEYISEKYSLADENKIVREYLADMYNLEKKAQFEEYNSYVELCKARAKGEMLWLKQSN